MRLTRLPLDHAVRNLGRSPRRLALVVSASALVSFLVLAAVAFARGMERSFASSGLATNVILLGAGSEDSAERSEIAPTTAEELAASVDGLATYAGVVAASPEVHVALPVRGERRDAAGPAGGARQASESRGEPARSDDADRPMETRTAPSARTTDARASATDDDGTVPVPCRGITATAFLVHPQVRLAAGRWPARGADEVAVGAGALAAADASAIGARLEIAGEPFTVVGILEAPGTAMHGELWMRLERLLALVRRSTHSCVVAALGEAEFEDVEAFAASRLDLEVVAQRESVYYAAIAGLLAPLRVLAAATAALIASGAILAGINALHAAFVARTRECAVLRALGFRRRAIAASLVAESTIACAAGGLAGCTLGRLALEGLDVRLSMGSFALAPDASAIAAGLGAALLLGLVGALPGIARCLSRPIPEALRA